MEDIFLSYVASSAVVGEITLMIIEDNGNTKPLSIELKQYTKTGYVVKGFYITPMNSNNRAVAIWMQK